MELYLRGLLTGVFFGLWGGAALLWPGGRNWLSVLLQVGTVAVVALLQYRWAQRHVIPKGAAA